MSEKQNKITIEDLKTYLYSLDDEKTKKKEEEVNKYVEKCKANKKRAKYKDMQKIKMGVDREYEIKIKTKDDILELLDECATIPSDIERLEVAKYMIYRVNVRRAENTINKAIKKLGRIYNEVVELIDKKVYEFPEFDDIEEIDFSEYRVSGENLKKAKEEYKMEYTEEERMALIQKELDIIERLKVFNTIPIPHEILKNSDRDIQSKLPKFNNIRQKRLRVLTTMEADYVRLLGPKEISNMIDEAITSIDTVNDILTKYEYKLVKNSLIKRRKRVYRNSKDIRNTINLNEKKTGIANYNIQEARYARMENLRNIISKATKIIEQNAIPGVEEQLEKLRIAYEREKQFAAVIEKLEEDSKKSSNPNINTNSEVKVLERQINGLEKRINKSRKIISEQQEEIEKAKKELIILWKMEIDTTLSNRIETPELPETTQTIKGIKYEEEPKKSSKKAFLKLKKMQGGKHACA